MSLFHARQMDAADPLGRFREEFVVEAGGPIYLDGNSLGRLPRRAVGLAADLVQRQWGERLIRGWNDGWMGLPARLGAKLAALIGADADEVLVCDSTSVNLFKLATAAVAAQAPRRGIVTDRRNFPSDAYILQACGNLTIADDAVAAADGGTAVVSLTQTCFRTAAVYPLAKTTRRVQATGAWMLWDLSHSVGAFAVDLHASGAEMAVGCTYKYCNGGPGAPAFLYVRRDLQERLLSPIPGWLGHADPFAFSLEYRPAAGIQRFLAGTPAVLSMACMEPGLDLLLEAGMGAVEEKSRRLCDYLIAEADRQLAEFGVTVASPREAVRRGSHVSLRHPEAWRLTQSLINDYGVIPDFRAPDLIRFGVAPLYNSYEDVCEAVGRLRLALRTKSYERYDAARLAVT
jgi:kynureninase